MMELKDIRFAVLRNCNQQLDNSLIDSLWNCINEHRDLKVGVYEECQKGCYLRQVCNHACSQMNLLDYRHRAKKSKKMLRVIKTCETLLTFLVPIIVFFSYFVFYNQDCMSVGNIIFINFCLLTFLLVIYLVYDRYSAEFREHVHSLSNVLESVVGDAVSNSSLKNK